MENKRLNTQQKMQAIFSLHFFAYYRKAKQPNKNLNYFLKKY